MGLDACPWVRWAGRAFPTLRARSVPCRALPGEYPWNAHLGSIWRELTSFPIKLVKTAKCRRKVSKRSTLVPISQNGVQKSPLGILRFPYLLAFSPKELMGHFDASTVLYVKNDEVSTGCTPPLSREVGAQIPPLTTAASCLLWSAPHLGLARYSQRTRNKRFLRSF